MAIYYETKEEALQESIPQIIANINGFTKPHHQVGYFVLGNQLHTAQDAAVSEYYGLNVHKVESHAVLQNTGLLLKRTVRMLPVTEGMSADTPIAIDVVYSLHDPAEFELG